MMDKARDTALQVLAEVHVKGAYANVALAQALRQQKVSEQDRRFVTELVYGCVKAGDTLDWILRQYVNRSLAKIPPMIKEILRLGLYQLFYLEKIPASAACNEAVELAKKYGHQGTVRFVNAVLRSAVRQPEKAAFPNGTGNQIKSLALRLQHPEWLVRRLVKYFGLAEAEKLCRFDNTQPPLCFRVNTLRTSRENMLAELLSAGMDVKISDLVPEGIICLKHGALDALPQLQNGLLQVQDESSMLVAHIVAPQPGERVLDVCAAPGGKTTHLAALMHNQGEILAHDIYPHKVTRIKENAARLGVKIIKASVCDARTVQDIYGTEFDRVLVDAPCSGLGVLRRKPDARWRKNEQELALLPELQLSILQSAAKVVKPGGVLVYSTCTILKQENDQVVQKFLLDNKDFSLEQTGAYLPITQRPETLLQLYPQTDGTDGFFIARMRRKD